MKGSDLVGGGKNDIRYRRLRKLGSVKKSVQQTYLSEANILKTQNWTKIYMEIDFFKEIFADEFRASVWAKWWLLSDADVPVSKIKQQGGGSVEICAVIVDQTIMEPFKVDEWFKLNSAKYCNFMDQTFFEWYKSQLRSFKVMCVFTHNNTPCHVSKFTRQFFLA